ncbi:hypothetical protein [Undibacterium sp. YM2]|uniref:hypothetical protein n=1 Tax=Undibacterium sp. YM2 TaxID=2058625 RepID=UPI001389D9D9|nr:hypothetical protein [Undibacterium sp. YM2]
MQHKNKLHHLCIIALLMTTASLVACKKTADATANTTASSVAMPSASVLASTTETSTAAEAISDAIPASTESGPFGLAMAISETELASKLGFVKSSKAKHLFEGQPPKPADDFSDYYAVTAPISGVCKVGASRTITAVSGTGEQIKAAADRIAQALEQQYGKPSLKKDKVKTDIYNRRPQFWMVGLKEGSVSYGYLWANGKTERELPDNILNIIVFAQAHAINRGEVGVSYEFANYADCQKEWRLEKGRKS